MDQVIYVNARVLVYGRFAGTVDAITKRGNDVVIGVRTDCGDFVWAVRWRKIGVQKEAGE